MAVCPGESLITLAAELSAGMTPTPPVGAAHVGRNQTHPARRAIGRHRYCAAVNHWRREGTMFIYFLSQDPPILNTLYTISLKTLKTFLCILCLPSCSVQLKTFVFLLYIKTGSNN